MRSPEVILKNLGDKAKDKSYQFKRLYRNLYNPEMYLLAYQKIASSEGSMTAGTDGNTLDGMSMAKLINMPDAQIVSKFNSEIRGLYNYYRLAANVSVLNNFYRIMRGSLFKTFGCKYRTTYKHIKAKYVRDGIFSVKYSTKGGDKELQFYHDGFQQNVRACLIS